MPVSGWSIIYRTSMAGITFLRAVCSGMAFSATISAASAVISTPMTTFTTIFALIPMALARQTGSELQRPLALVVIGGLLFTTLLTLILIPVSYEVVENIREKRKARKEGLKPTGE